MSASVISMARSFYAKVKPSRPWTNQELAELYRIVDLLTKAGMSVETDAGLSDEGEPWFVFVQPDTGDVIAHFARIDGEFVAAASHSGKTLRGRDFRDVVDNIIDGQPLVFPRAKPDTEDDDGQKRSNVTRLYLHPAVVLTAFVATALLHTRKALAVESDSGPSSSSRTSAENNGRPAAGRTETSGVSSEAAAAVVQGSPFASTVSASGSVSPGASMHQTNVLASALAIVVAAAQSDIPSQDFTMRLAQHAEAGATVSESEAVTFDEPTAEDEGSLRATITDGPHGFAKSGGAPAGGAPKIVPMVPAAAQAEDSAAVEIVTDIDGFFVMPDASARQAAPEPTGDVRTIAAGSGKAPTSEQVATSAAPVEEPATGEASSSASTGKASSEMVAAPAATVTATTRPESSATDDTPSSSSVTMQVGDALLLRFGGVTVDDTDAFALNLVQSGEADEDSVVPTDDETVSDIEDAEKADDETAMPDDGEDAVPDEVPVTYVDAESESVQLSDGADRLFFSGGTLEVINLQPGIDTILISEDLMDGGEYASQTEDGTIVIHFSEGSSITLVGVEMSDLLA